jgi:hypothetical protein
VVSSTCMLEKAIKRIVSYTLKKAHTINRGDLMQTLFHAFVREKMTKCRHLWPTFYGTDPAWKPAAGILVTKAKVCMLCTYVHVTMLLGNMACVFGRRHFDDGGVEGSGKYRGANKVPSTLVVAPICPWHNGHRNSSRIGRSWFRVPPRYIGKVIGVLTLQCCRLWADLHWYGMCPVSVDISEWSRVIN